MAGILESPLVASLLESDFPEELYLIALSGKPHLHLCLRAENVPGYDVVHGVACGKDEAEARKIMSYYQFPGVPILHPFEEAREIAKSKGEPIMGLLLEDGEGHCIAFHFVR
ncbi:MAG TPA: hypothetical protein PLO61_00415 [Fimbriimonadaceae bacterium]|nr:hypothetical protein [Fimbriimonadaceae bacterium]HRJ32360.1 hypothetical protein [Fimbriimonadaceae bacterium]